MEAFQLRLCCVWAQGVREVGCRVVKTFMILTSFLHLGLDVHLYALEVGFKKPAASWTGIICRRAIKYCKLSCFLCANNLAKLALWEIFANLWIYELQFATLYTLFYFEFRKLHKILNKHAHKYSENKIHVTFFSVNITQLTVAN